MTAKPEKWLATMIAPSSTMQSSGLCSNEGIRSKDAIVYMGSGWNLYQYVEGRPLAWLDSSGNAPCDAIRIRGCESFCQKKYEYTAKKLLSSKCNWQTNIACFVYYECSCRVKDNCCLAESQPVGRGTGLKRCFYRCDTWPRQRIWLHLPINWPCPQESDETGFLPRSNQPKWDDPFEGFPYTDLNDAPPGPSFGPPPKGWYKEAKSCK